MEGIDVKSGLNLKAINNIFLQKNNDLKLKNKIYNNGLLLALDQNIKIILLLKCISNFE